MPSKTRKKAVEAVAELVREMPTDPVHLRLQELADANEGRITPDMVVDDGRDPESPFHSSLEWDDETAGHQYRLDQARRIIRSYRITIVHTDLGECVRVPAFLRDPSVPMSDQGYRSVVVLRDAKADAREALEAEMERVAGIVERVRHLAIGLGLESDLNSLRDVIDRVLGRLKKAA